MINTSNVFDDSVFRVGGGGVKIQSNDLLNELLNTAGQDSASTTPVRVFAFNYTSTTPNTHPPEPTSSSPIH